MSINTRLPIFNYNKYQQLELLAKAARCTNDDDWGSERQITAQNKFFDAVKTVLTRSQFEVLECYCNGATTDEMIDEALLSAKGMLS